MIKIRNKSPAGGFSFNDDVNQRSARRRWTWKIVNVVNAHRAARLLICESTDRKHRTMGSNMREMTNVVSRPDIHAPVTKLLLARECRLCHLGIRVTTRHAANRFQSSIIFELEPLDRHRNGLGRMTTTTMTCFPCEIMLISVKRVIRVFSAPPFLLARFLPRDLVRSREQKLSKIVPRVSISMSVFTNSRLELRSRGVTSPFSGLFGPIGIRDFAA